MSRSIPNAASDDQGLEGDNGAMDVGMESGDENTLLSGDDYASDRESSTSVKPIVNRAQFQPKIGTDDLEDAELPIDGSNNQRSKGRDDGWRRLNEGENYCRDIKAEFESVMEASGVATKIECIDKNLFNQSSIGQAKLQSFLNFVKAMKDITGGHANIKQAWFGAPKDQIRKILLHVFSYDNIKKDGDFGYGLYLSTDNAVMESVKSATVDDDGTRHIVLCRVILGNVEVVQHGSKQCYASSEKFQSGVDNLNYAKKFIIWSSNMNTHILPEYVISFKTLSSYNGAGIVGVQSHCPHCVWIPSDVVVTELSKILPPETMLKITDCYKKYTERKISHRDMLAGFRDLAGEKALLKVVKDYKERQQLEQAKMMDSNVGSSLGKQANPVQ